VRVPSRVTSEGVTSEGVTSEGVTSEGAREPVPLAVAFRGAQQPGIRTVDGLWRIVRLYEEPTSRGFGLEPA